MELPEPRDNQVLFLDMNAFFASCEQHKNPDLRGKPVGVTPTMAPTGTLIAASYEAKRQGVSTFCYVREAQRRIPDIHIVHSDHVYYKQIHERIVSFLREEIAPVVHVLSIDEFAIPLCKSEQWTPNAHALALRIKQRLTEIFSPALRCSIGIGPNKFLAKLGTEVQKPDGLVVIQKHTLPLTFVDMKLTTIPGINTGMSTRLRALGIHNALEFFHAPRTLLRNAFGILGEAWWFNLHGYFVEYTPRELQSMSHSHVLAPKLRSKQKARAVLYKLLLKVGDRLRNHNIATTYIYVKVKSLRGRWDKEFTTLPTQDIFALFREVAQAYDTELPDAFAPYQIVVVAYNFQSADRVHPRFIEITGENPKAVPLLASMDAINRAFGRWTIQPASILTIKDAAPNRITFRAPTYDMD